MKKISSTIELPELKTFVDSYLETDPAAKQIAEIQEAIQAKEREKIELEAKLMILEKTRPKISIPYRDSIMWCLNVDAGNPSYFLKSKEGLVKCVQYKHKVKLTQQQSNAFGSVLSMMFKEGKIGRISHLEMFFYGLPQMFQKDETGLLTVLKKEHQKNVSLLKQVNI